MFKFVVIELLWMCRDRNFSLIFDSLGYFEENNIRTLDIDPDVFENLIKLGFEIDNLDMKKLYMYIKDHYM